MRITTILGLLCFVGATLSAQTKPAPKGTSNPNPRAGFWIGFGLGDGSAGVDCSSCSTDRTSGLSGYLRLGGTVSQSVLLGVETNGWVHSESGTDETLGFGSFILTWYPSRTGAFYLKFGLGAMTYKATSGSNELTATAPSGSFGLGYDIRVGHNFSITPFLNSLATSGVALKLNGQPLSTNQQVKVTLVQFGLGVTWH